MRLIAFPVLIIGIGLIAISESGFALWLGIVIAATSALVILKPYLGEDSGPSWTSWSGGGGDGDCGGGD